jgi:hypothetical protein
VTTSFTIVNQAGTYYVNVTKGTWVGKDTFKVAIQNVSAIIKTSNFNNFGVSCANKKDGSIEITNLSIATNLAKITWNTGDTSLSLKGLSSGTYDVKITSKEGCVYRYY